MNLVEMFEAYAEELGFGPRILHLEGVGFATYHLHKDECYIEDIYVVPEKRKDRFATVMADSITLIAKRRGIPTLTGTVTPGQGGWEISKKALEAYGFKHVGHKEDGAMIYAKEI
jgi:GNAT superfamily N-acetyltransferase